MGQYHKVYNLDKKQFINAHGINNGLKLMERVGFEKSAASALFLLLANSNGKGGRGGGDCSSEHKLIGSWAGDRILIQGDYAEKNDRSYVPKEELDTYENISSDVMNMLNESFEDY